MSILAPNRKPTSGYQPLPWQAPPLPPAWRPPAMWERHGPDSPLWRFVILSMLLHLLGILLFGAPAGGSRDGRSMWGSLDVMIQDSYREPAPALRFDRGLALPGPAPRVEPQIEAPPPAAANAPEPVPPVIDRLERRIEPPAFEVPTPSEPVVTPRLERQLAEPPKIEAPPLPLEKPIEVPKIELPVAPRIDRPMLEPPKIEAPAMPPPKPIAVPRIEAPAVPRIEQQMAEPPKIEAPPMPPPKPVEVPRMEVPAVPRIERTLAEPPKIDAPVVQPAEPATAPRIETPAVPKVAAPPSVAPSAPEVQQAPRATSPTEPAAPPALREPVTPRIERDAAPAQAPSPFRAPPATKDKADYDPTAPALDLDALRKRASDLTRSGTGNRAALPFPMPPVDKPKTKMEDAIEKARKPDCRTAYQSLGLAAVVPLIANEFGEGNCRW